MIKEKITAGCPRYIYIGQIECNVRVKTLEEFKENSRNKS